jgi:hypothetical protein
VEMYVDYTVIIAKGDKFCSFLFLVLFSEIIKMVKLYGQSRNQLMDGDLGHGDNYHVQ